MREEAEKNSFSTDLSSLHSFPASKQASKAFHDAPKPISQADVYRNNTIACRDLNHSFPASKKGSMMQWQADLTKPILTITIPSEENLKMPQLQM
jgi:hypothetical protein